MGLELEAGDRTELWQALVDGIDSYLAEVVELGAGRQVDRAAVAKLLDDFDFDRPLDPHDALRLVLRGLRDQQQHNRHPRHFGLFDAAPTTMAIIGDTLAAVFNACLATRDGSPFGVAAEDKLISAFGTRFGYRADEVDGIVTSGGSESNLSAIILALRHRFAEYCRNGLVDMAERPVVYVSAEAHPSIPKAVRLAGLGAQSVRTVETDDALRISLAALRDHIVTDRLSGLVPLAIVVTAGTTGSGIIDPLDGAAELAAEHDLWLHVDAAWGGAAALLPELGGTFRSLGEADSVTFDPHKWMSMPLGMGMLLTRHRGLLERAFGVDDSFLDAPPGAAEPFARSIRWTRGFTGLKLLLSLAVAGWRGFEDSLREQVQLGEELRHKLTTSGWSIVNDTPLPVVCFVPECEAEQGPDQLRLLAKMVNATGEAKIFVVKIGARYTLRACITNHATTSADIGVLVDLLGDAIHRVRLNQVNAKEFRDVAVDAGTCQLGG
jgi:glutamate/tyrosine decarboxylase-like PLP-dependent enzyme